MDKNRISLIEYDKWNERKKKITVINQKLLFKKGDIWWCSLGVNVGGESTGKGEWFRRPVLIVKKLSNHLCIVIPVTTKEKSGSWFQEINIGKEKRWVLLNQIRMVDTARFQRRMATLDNHCFNQVKQKLELLLELS